MSPLLIVRSFVVLALSRWDFVFSGVLAPPSWHHDLQVYAHKAYRAAFALPPWSCNAFLHLPLHAGGVGCPSLPLRNLSLLAMTYLHASVSRNPLSRASAVYLLDTLAPFSEGMALRTALATLRTRVHTNPFPHLHDMRVHAHVASSHPLPDILHGRGGIRQEAGLAVPALEKGAGDQLGQPLRIRGRGSDHRYAKTVRPEDPELGIVENNSTANSMSG